MTPPPAHTLRHACLALVLANLTTPAPAATPCNQVSFTATPPAALGAARIRPGARVTFLGSDDGCPNDTPSCRQDQSVLPNDVVLTGATHAAYTCAYVTHGQTEAAGWLPTAQLQPQPRQPAPRPAWLGPWRHGDNTLTLAAAGPTLAITGQAYWPAKADPDGHEGHLGGPARLAQGTLAYTDPDDPEGCTLTATLVAGHLVARDNTRCGGANVSFSGVYVRAAPARQP